MGSYSHTASQRDWKKPRNISKLQHYGDWYNQNEIEFPLAIQKIGKFEKNNSGIAVNVSFNSKKCAYISRGAGLDGKCCKQASQLIDDNGQAKQALQGNEKPVKAV